MPTVSGATRVNDVSVQDTYIDRQTQLPPGHYTKLGLYMPNAGSVELKVTKEISSTEQQVIFSEVFAHPGGGMKLKDVSFDVPTSGVHRMGAYVNLVVCGVASIPRTTRQGNATGTQSGWYPMTGNCLCMQAVYDEEEEEEDPEEPGSGWPPLPNDFTLAFIGQSGAYNLGNRSIIASRFAALAEEPCNVLNLGHPSSPISYWAPGTAYRAEVCSSPMTAAVFHSGEYEAQPANVSEAIEYGDRLCDLIHAVLAARGPIQIFVIELFSNPRPYTKLIRTWQRAICTPGSHLYVPGAILIDARHYVGTLDAGIHLDGARLDSLGLDVAEAAVRAFHPLTEILRTN